MEAYIVEKSGATLGCLYQVLIEECIANLQDQCEEAQARRNQDGKAEQFPVLAMPELRKEKTRLSQPSTFELAPSPPAAKAQEPAHAT
ncbi:hypothetical protein CDV36_005427 [Fusarium kuroshium]|uniref:Uncharacterized protein n=1 Tax=Fusarium kuroshium TaxID=2010991 RepID=A0A3M2SBH6_9HYPO|nr:hypothetical protein CDV36_005427 [Fusarium kuroshium]